LGVSFDHSTVAGQACASVGCHDGVSPRTFKSGNHPLTSNLCDACHTTTVWTPVTTPFAHDQTTAQCSVCHNGSIARGKSGTHPQSTNSCDGCHTTGPGWRNFLPTIDHSQTTALCTQCHNNSVASGKPTNHLSTTAQCDVCHLITAWLPASFDHATVVAQPCAASGCHDGVSPRTFKSGNHPLTSNLCDRCHTSTAWTPVTTPFAHDQTTAQCSVCHNGNIARGKGGTHPQSTNSCDGCHTTGPGWRNFLPTIDHSQTQDICTRCHGSVATGKPGNHPLTSEVCEACHRTTQWLPLLTMDHSQIDASTCKGSGCHSLPNGHCTISAPLGDECSQCHTPNGWTSAQTCNLSPNGAPTAVINGPTSAGVGSTLTFDGRSSFDPDNDPLTYNWTIEGQNSSGPQVSHTFNTVGNVIVRLVVNDGQSNSAPDQLTVNVSAQQPTNQAPTARINGPSSGNQGARLTFDGGGSSDPDGSISSYSWTIEGQNYSGISASHTFNNPGNVQVRLVVTDNAGANSPAATQNVNITAPINRPPIVVISGPASGCTGEALAFNSSGTRDPDNDPLSYQWRVTPAGASFSSPRQANTTITFSAAGTKTVTLEVTDTAQNTGSDSLSVTIQAGGMGGMGAGCGGGM
jgi:PKD repeat protein